MSIVPYILGIDQSTAGTKAILFDHNGRMVGRSDRAHEQKVSAEGWISHDPLEIYRNTLLAINELLTSTEVDKTDILGVGISNQRETALVWDKRNGLPMAVCKSS